MCKVAIIIPCYNLGGFLPEAVDSALKQTHPDLEVIVVDDGSDDPATLTQLAALESQPIKLLRKPNTGLAEARNHGIAHTDATFILPLDADDRIAPTLVAKAVAVIQADSSVGIVSCEAEFFDLVSGPWQLPPLRFPDMLLTPALFATALFRRADWEQVGGYKSDMIYGYEDHEFWLSLLELGRQPHRIPESLFHYRQREGSMSARIDADQKKESFRKCLSHHPQLFADNIPFLLDQFVEQNEAQRKALQPPFCQVFFSHQNGFTEEWSIRSSYLPGEPVRLTWETLPLSHNEAGQIRLDPGDRPGIYRIHEIEIKSVSDGALILVAKLSDIGRLIMDTGDGLILPSDNEVIFLSYGQDPRLLLQDRRFVPTGEAWRVSVIIQFTPDITSAGNALGVMSRGSNHHPGLI